MNTVISSDIHLGHLAMSQSRGFGDDVEAHDRHMIDTWNRKVKPNDDVYFLGDLTLKSGVAAVKQYIEALNGRFYIIRGNHDRGIEKYLKDHPDGKVKWIKDVYMLKLGLDRVWLSHYAHRVWPKRQYGSWHLYGHSHGNLKACQCCMAFDVGVDCHNLSPLLFSEVQEIMSKKRPLKVILTEISKSYV